MKIIADGLSKKGGRKVNEDYAGFACRAKDGCFLVADGLGAKGGGDIASESVVETVLEEYQEQPGIETDDIMRMLTAAQTELRAEQKKDERRAGIRTTLVQLVIEDGYAAWAHIGDSRLYRFRDGYVAFQTKDHSVPQTKVAAGEITADQIRNHPDRNRLTRAMGSPNAFRPAVLETPIRLERDDAFLLCTDGFWEYVLEGEMEDTLDESRTPGEWLASMERILLTRAGAKHDNYAAVAVFLV
jgi:serine/threonine protein phosphatase PrpC